MKSILGRVGVLAAVALLLAGCANGMKYNEMASSLPTLKQDQGRIFFFRSRSILGVELQPHIRLNGDAVGQSRPGGFFYVDRPAGQYMATVSTETQKTLSLTLSPGEVKYVRSSVGMGIVVGRILLELEDPGKAKAELKKLRFTGAAPEMAANR